MKHCSLFILILLFCALLVRVPSISAASSDGSGPWADSVVTSNQGLMKNGLPVPLVRSNPQAAVGIAEQTTEDGVFYSLGFGGSITLSFDNPVKSGVVVIEATNPDYPYEQAKVEVSSDGSSWVTAGTVIQDGQVSLPNSVSCTKYVRVTDISDKNQFSDETADGYDVDGVKTVSGEACGSGTDVVIHNTTNCDIEQSSTTVGVTTITNKASTGGNKLKKISGGSSTIKTSTAKAKTKVVIKGGSNTADVDCCTSSSIQVVVQGNG